MLGLVYLLAFWSLGSQIPGLVGHNGILPAEQYLADAHTLLGSNRFQVLPTLAWISASDGFLQALCFGGSVLAVLLTLGLLPWLVLPFLWLVYLSLTLACGDFLSYQWDALLLEAGFLAIFLAPAVRRERLHDLIDPPRVAVGLFLWLLFRLMAGSGAVKLMSGDPTWRNLTALSFHFETQPIPTAIAWYVHWLPAWFLKASTALVFAIEIGAPFLMLARSRRWRALAFGLLVGLQAVIALTGNYAFFNLLSAALCLFLLDDVSLGNWGALRSTETAIGRPRRTLLIAVAAFTVPISVFAFTSGLGLRLAGSNLLAPLVNLKAPFRSVNAYGLFAVMTTTRPEIVVEGSDDGTTWLEYEFKYKAGDVHRRPPWVAPHQPRLDWQMWFAALGRIESEGWFQNFCLRLLEADADVLKLLERDPFQGRRPKFVRAILYRYRFADPATRRRDGVWWTRERLGDYSPVFE